MEIDMIQQQNQFTPGFGSGNLDRIFFNYPKLNLDKQVLRLSHGTSVSVFGLKKIGKTSLLTKIRECLRTKGKDVIWVNLDKSDSPAAALSTILGSMKEGKNKSVVADLKDWVNNLESVSAEMKVKIVSLISGNFSKTSENIDYCYVDALLQQTGLLLKALDSENKPIIIFDELTTFIKNTIDQSNTDETLGVVEHLNNFLGQLNHWRADDVRITMAVSGSESFSMLERKYKIKSDLINGCIPVFIKEMNRAEARRLLGIYLEANNHTTWNEQLIEELLDFIPAYFPSVVQLAFKVVVNLSVSENSISHLDDSIRHEILEELWIQYYNQLDARFHNFRPSEQRRICKLFKELESQGGGMINYYEATEILNEGELPNNDLDGGSLITYLKSDSFIDTVDGGIRFASRLVTAWRNNPKLL